MLEAIRPIPPTRQYAHGLGGALPNSPTRYELRRALFDHVSYSTHAFEWMEIHPENTYQYSMEKINTLIRQLGNNGTKIFFHRPDDYQLEFLEEDQDSALSQYQEYQQLNAEEIEYLNLGQVQSALIGFRDSTQQLWERSQANVDNFPEGLKDNQKKLTESLNRILQLGLRLDL